MLLAVVVAAAAIAAAEAEAVEVAACGVVAAVAAGFHSFLPLAALSAHSIAVETAPLQGSVELTAIVTGSVTWKDVPSMLRYIQDNIACCGYFCSCMGPIRFGWRKIVLFSVYCQPN